MKTKTMCLAAFIVAMVPLQAAAQTRESVVKDVAEAAANVATADLYMNEFFHRNMGALKNYWTEGTVMRDRAFGMEIVGVDDLMVQIPDAWAGVEIQEINVVSRFGAMNGVVTYFGTLRGLIAGDGKTMRFDVPYQTILILEDDHVAVHETFFNYPCMNMQALAQAEGALAYELLPSCLR